MTFMDGSAHQPARWMMDALAGHDNSNKCCSQATAAAGAKFWEGVSLDLGLIGVVDSVHVSSDLTAFSSPPVNSSTF